MGKTNEHSEARGDNMSYAFPCVALTRLVLAKPWRLVVSSEGDLHQNSSKDCFHASSSLVLNLGKSTNSGSTRVLNTKKLPFQRVLKSYLI